LENERIHVVRRDLAIALKELSGRRRYLLQLSIVKSLYVYIGNYMNGIGFWRFRFGMFSEVRHFGTM
jgi:hypothetical protein